VRVSGSVKVQRTRNQRQPSDQKRLEQGIEQGIAKRARDLLVDVTCVVEESDGPRDFATAVERQSGDVHRNPLLRIVERELVGRQKLTNSSVLFCGTCGRFGADPENRRKSRGDGECAAGCIVNDHPSQMLALAEAFDKPWQIFSPGASSSASMLS